VLKSPKDVMFPQSEQVAQYVRPLPAASSGQPIVLVGAGRSSGMIGRGSRCLVFPNWIR
jgi:hypothetical protein